MNVKGFFRYLLRGNRDRRKVGAVPCEPLSAGRQRIDVWAGWGRWQGSGSPRVHLETVFTSTLAYRAMPVELSPESAQTLVVALKESREIRIPGERLQWIGRQELIVEPRIGGEPPHAARLTFTYSALMVAFQRIPADLGGPAIAGLIGLIERALQHLKDGSVGSAA